MKSFYLISLIFCLACTQKQSIKIAVGSCSHEYDEDQMWPEITAEKPDLFIWGGDIIYGDTSDMKILWKKYMIQKNRPSYQELLKTVPVIGIWDDHDYGVNDGGKNFKQKKESKKLLMDFLDVSDDNPVFNHDGAYNTFKYNVGNKILKIILLDTRYFRDSLYSDTTGHARYFINPEGDVLGESQWDWLDEEYQRKDADLNIMVSGVQYLSIEQAYEKWGNFPKAYNRLKKFLQKYPDQITFIVSGDRHIAELSRADFDTLNYPLYDFTSSGLTHTWDRLWDTLNTKRVGKIIIEKNYGILDVSWNGDDPQVKFQVKGDEQELFFEYEHQY